MRRRETGAQRGYVGLFGLVVVVGLIGLLYYYVYVRPGAGLASATSTPTRVGQSGIEQDFNALGGAKAIQDVSAKHAAEVNTEMQ